MLGKSIGFGLAIGPAAFGCSLCVGLIFATTLHAGALVSCAAGLAIATAIYRSATPRLADAEWPASIDFALMAARR